MVKKFIQKVLTLVLLSVSLQLPLYGVVDYVVENQPLVLEQVAQFEQKGVLKQKDNGYLYVDVSNDYITYSLPLLDVPGKLVPPSHYTSKNGIGAHISVIYENELIDNEIWEIEELGQEYSFTVMELRTVKMTRDNKIKKLWLIAVDAPELEQLREKYGLSSFLKGHNFHITIGTQVPEVAKKVQMIVPFVVEEIEETADAA
jgi:hypothetical protein